MLNMTYNNNETNGNSLSYKFQRCERLRAAVASGELSGKLPGERLLGKRFGVNPKTLSKALTDLAAEGMLDRSIGRGTYVMGSRPGNQCDKGRWLILTDGTSSEALVAELMRLNPESHVSTDTKSFRPSFINGFSAVIDLAAHTPESLHRSLLVRSIPLVLLGQEPRVNKTHAVLFDREYAVFLLGRRLLLSGHRKLLAIETEGGDVLLKALRDAAQRYEPDAQVEACAACDVAKYSDERALAIVCDSAAAASGLGELIKARKAAHARWDLTAVGVCAHPPCSGYFVDPAVAVQAVADVLRDVQAHRPSVLWLVGEYVETTARGSSQPAILVAVPA